MLRTRIVAASLMLPAALAWVWLAPAPVFAIVAALVLLAGGWEWISLAGMRTAMARWTALLVMLALLFATWWALRLGDAVMPLLWAFLLFWLFNLVTLLKPSRLWNSCPALVLQGVMVLAPAFYALLLLRRMNGGTALVFAAFAIVWSADIGAYFAGRAAGRHKLAPHVSPGKTWEGVMGGLLLAAVAGALASVWCPMPVRVMVPLALLTAAVSVLGDLTESRLKRLAGAKESGWIIPGHGGILDRIDSLSAALPIFALGVELGQRLW